MDKLCEYIFKDLENDYKYYLEKYPSRNLNKEAVTRYAPSPTGFVHMGALYTSLINKKYALQTGGIFYLRIEDTDKKREVENGITSIIKDLLNYHIYPEEGIIGENEEYGLYGPYIQSNRRDIYRAFAKKLLEEGKAYVSFASEEELDKIRKEQEEKKERIGYYGKYATDRNLKVDEVLDRITKEEYVIRLKSEGDFNKKIELNDLVKGKIEFPENDLDVVILKKDGLPTYHFAHAVDDYLMHTTVVIRGDEWLSSYPIHYELFKVLNFKMPKYAHISPLLKDDNGVRRKLSKRKDPEAAVSFYEQEGIPYEAVLLYLMTIANSNFEEYMRQNKENPLEDFTFDFKKMSKSGALFDLEKLKNVSKNFMSMLSKDEIYDNLLEYTKKYDSEFNKLIIKYKDETIDFLDIERNTKKPRKDFYAYGDIKNYMWYMYDELFNDFVYDFKDYSKEEVIKVLDLYISKYHDITSEEIWFEKLKDLSEELGYAREVKEYKNNPDNYKGHVGDISMMLRIAFTSLSNTPNLYNIIKILGKDRLIDRANKIKKEL